MLFFRPDVSEPSSVGSSQIRQQPLPCKWFDSLALEQVHVKATFDKKGSTYRTPEEWIRWGSDVQYMSVSFENLKLPTSPSLLKLFPKEALDEMRGVVGFNLTV